MKQPQKADLLSGNKDKDKDNNTDILPMQPVMKKASHCWSSNRTVQSQLS